MRIVCVTCVLLTITIGSFAASTGGKQDDKPAVLQPVTTVAEPSVPANNSTNNKDKPTTPIPVKPSSIQPNNHITTPEAPNTTSGTTTAIPPSNVTNATVTPATEPTKTTNIITTPKPTAKPTVAPEPTTPPPTPTTASTHSTTTAHPGTTMASPSSPEPSKERHFDGLSFFGGFFLAACLVVVAGFSWKFFRSCSELNYRTL